MENNLKLCWSSLQSFSQLDADDIEEEATFYSLMFIVIAVVAASSMFLQVLSQLQGCMSPAFKAIQSHVNLYFRATGSLGPENI